MSNTKSAEKAMRVAERKLRYNKPIRSAAKTFVRKAEKLIEGKEGEPAKLAVIQAVRALDKAAQKGVIHPNNTARRKSRLMKKFNIAQKAQAEAALKALDTKVSPPKRPTRRKLQKPE